MHDWKQQARKLKRETYALYLACQDSRVPLYVRVLATCVVAYALSPIDLIPDFIPVLGYLDDLILVPLGIALVLRMIPPNVMTDCREQASKTLNPASPSSRIAAVIIVVIWIFLGIFTAIWIGRMIKR